MYEYAYKQTLTFLTTHVSLLSSKKMFMYENLQIFKNAYFIFLVHFGFLDYGSIGSMRIQIRNTYEYKYSVLDIQTGHF